MTDNMTDLDSLGFDLMEEEIPVDKIPTYKLHSVGSIIIASILGSPIAGAALMAINYNRLNRPWAGSLIIVLATLGVMGLLVFPVFYILGPLVLLGFRGMLFLHIGIMYYLSKFLQGPMIEEHRKFLGEMASKWQGLAAGLIGLGAWIVFFVGLDFLEVGLE